MKVRILPRLSALRLLVFCNILHIYIYMSGPSLLIESTNSMILLNSDDYTCNNNIRCSNKYG